MDRKVDVPTLNSSGKHMTEPDSHGGHAKILKQDLVDTGGHGGSFHEFLDNSFSA